jgi:excisionase family DNA binding protein
MAKANQPPAGAVNPASPHAAGLHNAAILTKEQAAQYLGSSVRFVERQIRAGKLRACKPTGKFVRIFRTDIDQFLLNFASMAT